MRYGHHLHGICLLIAGIGVLGLGAHADAEENAGSWNVPNLLARAPEDALGSVALPGLESIAAILDLAMKMTAMGGFMPAEAGTMQDMLDDIASGFGLSEVTTVKGLIDALGLDGVRPVGVSLKDIEKADAVFFLPVRDSDLFLKQTGIGDAEPVEIGINGERCRAGVAKSEDAAFLVYRDYILISTSVENLKWAAEAFGTERPIRYGSETFPVLRQGEWVVQPNLPAIGKYLAASGDPEMAMFTPSLAALAAQFDNALAAWHMTPDTMTLRVAGHDATPGTDALPGPLSLPALLPAKPMALAALRISDGLTEFVRTCVNAFAGGIPMTQIEGFFNFVTGLLGDEVAIDVLDASETELRAVAVAKTPSPEMLESMIGMVGLTQDETAAQGQIFKSLSGLPEPVGQVFYTTTPELFIVGTDIEDVQYVLDRVKGASPGSENALLDEEIMARANHGLLFVNNLRMMQMIGDDIPGMALTAMMQQQNSILTIEQHSTWRQIALSAPNGSTAVPAMALPALIRSRESARRASSQNNLKQMGLVFKMYANEHKDGVFPAISSKTGCLMAEASEIYPEYLTDPSVLVNPRSGETVDLDGSDHDAALKMVDDGHYLYLSHAIVNEEQGLAYVAAYRKAAEAGTPFTEDFDTPTGTLYRLKEGVEKRLVREEESENPAALAICQSRIPVMMERPLPDVAPDGINVLYLDGRVDFLRKGTFPYTDHFMSALLALDDLETKE